MPTTNAIAGLHHFQLKGNGSPDDKHLCRVYKNGRQQFSITVVIDAYDDRGEIVPLTLSQLQSVEFVKYDGGELTGFTRSATKNTYEYFLGTRAQDTNAFKQDMSNFTFYFTVNPNVTFKQFQVSAHITLDGVTYKTNDLSAPPGGDGSTGGFNSSVMVEAVEPYVLRAADFTIAKLANMSYGYLSGEGPKRYLGRWEITFRNSNYKIRGSSIRYYLPIGWFSQYVRNGSDLDTCHWALPVLPVGSVVFLGWHQSGASAKDCYVQPYTRNDAAYAVIEEANWLETMHYTSTRISYYDQYGCEHSVLLKPNDNGTTYQIDDN